MEIITFHDSCYLGRHSKIYEEPREILEALGYQIEELDNNEEDCFCCGSCGNLPFTNPELANKIAKEKISQAKRIGIKKIIVTSFDNYNLLRKNSKNSGVEILELSDVIANSLDIQKIIYEEEIEGEEKILAETRANMRLKDELKDEDDYDEQY
jgi:Fe-S oxidoreductase